MTSHRLFRFLLLCCQALAGAGCASADAPVAKRADAPAKVSSDALLATMKTEVGDAACDNAAQCHSMAVGAKPCGGPEGYLAWSSKRNDGTRLRALAQQQAAARKDENARSGIASSCMAVTDPGATCQASRCTLLPRGIVAPPDRAD